MKKISEYIIIQHMVYNCTPFQKQQTVHMCSIRKYTPRSH
jgi:hypothetical protein